MTPTGLKEGDFDLVFQGATPARLAALQSGAADAAMLTSPFDFMPRLWASSNSYWSTIS